MAARTSAALLCLSLSAACVGSPEPLPPREQIPDRLPRWVDRVEFVGEPTLVTAFRGSIWSIVRRPRDVHLVAVDPTTRALISSVDLEHPTQPIAALTAGGGALWALRLVFKAGHWRSRLLRIDPDEGTVGHVTGSRSQWGGLAWGFGSLWVSDEENDRVLRLDARGRRIGAIIDRHGPSHVTVGLGSVWVNHYEPVSVSRIGPKTQRVVASFPDVGFEAFGTRGIWVQGRFPDGGALVEMDPTTGRQFRRALGFSVTPVSVAVTPDGRTFVLRWFYIAGVPDPVPEGPPPLVAGLRRFDPRANRLVGKAVALPHAFPGEAPLVAFGALWAPAGKTLLRLPLDARALSAPN